MKCRDCEKKLKGGFKQEDDSFLCARCVIAMVNKESDKKCFQEIESLCSALLVPYKRAKKSDIAAIRSRARAALAVNHKPTQNSDGNRGGGV